MPFLLLAILTVCNLRILFIGEHIVKRDNKRPFHTSLKYDKEIKGEVETERRELSDQDWNTSLGIFGKFTSHKDEFIQIVHGNHHWIVVGGKEEQNTVEIYDSLANGATKKDDSPSNMSTPVMQ